MYDLLIYVTVIIEILNLQNKFAQLIIIFKELVGLDLAGKASKVIGHTVFLWGTLALLSLTLTFSLLSILEVREEVKALPHHA